MPMLVVLINVNLWRIPRSFKNCVGGPHIYYFFTSIFHMPSKSPNQITNRRKLLREKTVSDFRTKSAKFNKMCNFLN